MRFREIIAFYSENHTKNINTLCCQHAAFLAGQSPKVLRQKNMVVSPAGPATKNDHAGEDQQQFTRPTQEMFLLR
jgi:hypothetical protein